VSTLNIQYSIEEEPLGTGGAIQQACKVATRETVLVVNGDTLYKANVDELVNFHALNNADCTLALKPMHNFDRYGVVEMNEDHSIKSFQEKKYYEKGYINGGVYALSVSKFLNEDLP